MQNKTQNNENMFGGVEWYREKIIEIISQVEDKLSLKQIYTVAITLKEMLDEEKRG